MAGILNRFPAKVLIFEKREGGGIDVFTDKGRRVVEKTGEIVYQLKKRKGYTRPLPKEHVIGGRNMLMVYSPGEGEYHPTKLQEIWKKYNKDAINAMTRDELLDVFNKMFATGLAPMTFDTANIKAIPDEDKTWLALNYKLANMKYNKPSFLEKYMPFIMFMVVGVTMAIVIYTTFNGMGEIVEGLQMVAESFKESANIIASAVKGPAPPF